MAERRDTSLKDLEKEITCAICHEHYTDPKVLSCCHYYCKQCILSLAKRTGLDKPFSCPECRKDTTLPQGGVDKLQGAFFVNRLQQVHSNLELATGEVEANCEICFEDKATAFCRQCAKFICADCVKSHKRMKMIFPDHKITTLEGLKEGGAKEIVTPEPTFQTCKMHEEKMKLFCFDCGCLICRDCTIKDHRDHNYQFVKKAAPEIKKKLSQHLEPLKDVKKDLVSAVKEVQTTKSKLETKEQSMVGGAEKWCDELCQIIQHHKKQLVAEVKNKISQKTGSLGGQEKGLSISCAGADSVIEFTQHCMEHSTDAEIMCMYSELQSRINQEIEEHRQKNIEPVEEDDVALEVGGTEELKKLCQTTARITFSLKPPALVESLCMPSRSTGPMQQPEHSPCSNMSTVSVHQPAHSNDGMSAVSVHRPEHPIGHVSEVAVDRPEHQVGHVSKVAVDRPEHQVGHVSKVAVDRPEHQVGHVSKVAVDRPEHQVGHVSKVAVDRPEHQVGHVSKVAVDRPEHQVGHVSKVAVDRPEHQVGHVSKVAVDRPEHQVGHVSKVAVDRPEHQVGHVSKVAVDRPEHQVGHVSKVAVDRPEHQVGHVSKVAVNRPEHQVCRVSKVAVDRPEHQVGHVSKVAVNQPEHQVCRVSKVAVDRPEHQVAHTYV